MGQRLVFWGLEALISAPGFYSSSDVGINFSSHTARIPAQLLLNTFDSR